jgi:hypothetical protein
MFWTKIGRGLISRPVFMGGGAAAVALAALLTWVNLSAPLNSRQPVPSPDGKYFAYFDWIQPFLHSAQNHYELIVSRPDGHEVARFSIPAGNLSWSNAGDLAVINAERNGAVLIANSDGRFLIVHQLSFARGTEPRWSTDGTKIAHVQAESEGGGITIYDFLQTRSSPVSFPEGFHSDAPRPLFWSPGGGALFFLNSLGQTVVLERVDIQDVKVQDLATGPSRWRDISTGTPRLSPDGTKIYLPPPLNSVIDAQTGKTIWVLPPASKVSWSLWSADGRQIYYSRANDLKAIIAHDLANSSDRVILEHAEPDDFFSADGESYFHRLPPHLPVPAAGQSLGKWLRSQWGWKQETVASRSETPMGRALLKPWAETRDGLILMFRDDYLRVRYGLYDPQSRTLADFVFPTDGEDLFQQARSQAFILVSVLLYGALAFLIYLGRTDSPSARAFYILSLTLMVLFASFAAQETLQSLESAPHPWNATGLDLIPRGWYSIETRLALLEGARACFAVALALLFPFALHFAFVLPEGNRLPKRTNMPKLSIYGAACLPSIWVVWNFNSGGPTNFSPSSGPDLFNAAGTLVIIVALFAILHMGRHPHQHRAPRQFRWAILALAVPLAGLVARWVLHIFLVRLG